MSFERSLPMLFVLCAAGCSAGGAGGNGNSPGSVWGQPFPIGPSTGGVPADAGIDAAGNILLSFWNSRYATFDGSAWVTGTHGLASVAMAVDNDRGLLLGLDPAFNIELFARSFSGGSLGASELLVTSTSGVRELLPVITESGAAAFWYEDNGAIRARIFDPSAGWLAPTAGIAPVNSSMTRLLGTALSDDHFIVAWDEGLGTAAAELESGVWSATQAFSGDPLALAALSDGRAVFATYADSDVFMSLFTPASGWSPPEMLDLPPGNLSFEVDASGNAFVAAGGRVARFDGTTWGAAIEMSDDYELLPERAFELRGQGDGFAFSLCHGDVAVSQQPCVLPFDGSFGDALLIGEDLEGYGDVTHTGSALNDAGDGIATWTAPLDIAEPFSDIKLWGILREQ